MATWNETKYSQYTQSVTLTQNERGLNVSKLTADELIEVKKWLFNCTRVFGAPPQFTEIADPRVDMGSNYYTSVAGRSFLKNMGEMPTIISLYPGEIQYLNSLTGQDKGNLLNAFANANSNDFNNEKLQSLMDTAIGTNKSTMFYTIKSGMVNYIKYVNLLNRFAAIMMNIGDKKFPGTNVPYKAFDWANYEKVDTVYTSTSTSKDGSLEAWSNAVKQSVGASLEQVREIGKGIVNIFAGNYGIADPEKLYIHFYGSSQSSYSEDVSTSTTSSKIENLFSGALDSIAKEVQFISTGMLPQGAQNDLSQVMADSGDGVLTDLLKKGSAYLSGARIIFPQILDEVQFGRSVTVNCKFISPSGDPESIFLHCIAPLNHILACAFPRQYSENMYRMPFVCKLYSKGWFNFDMAVISNVRVNKGGDDTAWATNRLPTEIDVTFDVTALYSKMMITSTDNPLRAIGNYAMMEYLGSMCCLDLDKAQLNLKVEALKATLLNKATDAPREIVTKITTSGLLDSLRNAFSLTD